MHGRELAALVLIALGAATSAGAQAPSPRDHHGMATGPGGTVVLFGGSIGDFDDHRLHGDTWVWDAGGWRLAATDGPPAHSSVSMAYDSVRQEVVLFGGWTGGADLAETWTWDGAAWTRRDVTGPSPRSSAATAWDPWSRRVVLFGGCGAGDPGDTWAWDGRGWERLSTTGPGGRCGAALAPLGRTGGLVLYGGLEGRGATAVMPEQPWLWRNGAWSRLPVPGGPGGRANHAMVRDSDQDVLLVYGGMTADRQIDGDTWRFDGERWERLRGTAGARDAAAVAWDDARGRALLHGGRSAGRTPLGDTWIWRDGVWSPAPVDPGPRASHALVYHEAMHRTVLLGGVPEDQDGGVWAWDGTRWEQVGSDRGLGSRGHFALAYDPVRDRVLVHGGFGLRFGRDGGARHGDFLAWDGMTWTRLNDADTGPGVRDHHAMVWDRRRGELVLFGGLRGVPADQVSLGDTWIHDDDGWRQHDGVSPPARTTHRLAYDEARGRVVLFGGWGDDGLLADTWEWDGEDWHQVASNGPSPRFATRLAYDASIGRVVLYGGRGQQGNLGDTWEWDGARWTLIGEAGPGARNVHALAWDPDRERLVMYGGLSASGRQEDTWERDGRRWVARDRGEPGARPAGRGAAVGVWDAGRGALVVFGGIGAEPRAFGDLWAWSPAGWANLGPSVGGGPSPRFNAAGAWLPDPGQLVVYGGGGIDERRGDTHVLEAEGWREVASPGPPVRDCARMVARRGRGDAIQYGGMSPDGSALRETWRWDGRSWSRLSAGDGPAGTCFHALAYDSVRGQVVHFGGRGAMEEGRVTWVFDDDGWRLVDRAGPPPRDHHAMAWDARRGEVVLYGGGGQGTDGEWNGSILGDTWTWDGARWTRHWDTGAPARFHAPLLVDSPDGVLLFGGSDRGGSYADVHAWDGARWHLVAPGDTGSS